MTPERMNTKITEIQRKLFHLHTEFAEIQKMILEVKTIGDILKVTNPDEITVSKATHLTAKQMISNLQTIQLKTPEATDFVNGLAAFLESQGYLSSNQMECLQRTYKTNFKMQ